MKGGIWTVTLLVMSFLSGCGPHEVKVQPVQVEPVHLTLDINLKLEQQEIENAAAELSPVVGKPAPDFTLIDQDGESVTLSKLRSKWVILYFYPKDDTPGCKLEAKGFTDLLAQFREMNAEILGISEDSVESHCDFISKHNLGVTLLSDPEHKVMEQYGAWVVSALGDWRYGRAIRTTMIIDPASVIRHYWPEVIAQGHAERVLAKLAELYVDKPPHS